MVNLTKKYKAMKKTAKELGYDTVYEADKAGHTSELKQAYESSVSRKKIANT